MKNRYDIEEFYSGAIKNINELEKTTYYPGYFYRSIYGGSNNFYQKEQIESKKFDDMWIKTIESYFPSINKITLNLKSTLKYQSEITPIEKTKKINKGSVIHLMSHSNFIKEVTEDGVIPRQVLTVLPEIEYGIYENRFIMTLIARLRDFINRRVKLMREQLKAQHITHMNLSSTFTFEESEIEMTVDVKQSEEVNQRKVDEENKLVLARAEKMFKLITQLNNSQFMKIMQRYKPVVPPIMKTQIILSNADFKNAYLLWVYLDRYNELGYEYGVKTVNKRFTDVYTKRIHQSLMLMCTTMIANTKSTSIDKVPDEKANYKEKAAKTLLRLPLEIDPEPVAFEITDTGLNEYFLAKNKQILKQQFNSLIEEGAPFKVALKRALNQTISITNGLYESFFEYNGDDDIFHKLIKEDEDSQVMYKNAYDRYIVACSVREVKEQDFKTAIALERKWQKELKRLHKLRMEELAPTVEKEYTDIIEEIKSKYKEKLDILVAKNYYDKKILMKNNRMQHDAMRKKMSTEYNTKRKQLVEKWDARLAEEKKKIASLAKINKEKEEQNHKETMEKLNIEHKAKMEALETRYKELNQKAVDRIVKDANDKIERFKIRQQKLEEQRKLRIEKIIEKKMRYIEELERKKKERLIRESERILEQKRKQAEARIAKETGVPKSPVSKAESVK